MTATQFTADQFTQGTAVQLRFITDREPLTVTGNVDRLTATQIVVMPSNGMAEIRFRKKDLAHVAAVKLWTLELLPTDNQPAAPQTSQADDLGELTEWACPRCEHVQSIKAEECIACYTPRPTMPTSQPTDSPTSQANAANVAHAAEVGQSDDLTGQLVEAYGYLQFSDELSVYLDGINWTCSKDFSPFNRSIENFPSWLQEQVSAGTIKQVVKTLAPHIPTGSHHDVGDARAVSLFYATSSDDSTDRDLVDLSTANDVNRHFGLEVSHAAEANIAHYPDWSKNNRQELVNELWEGMNDAADGDIDNGDAPFDVFLEHLEVQFGKFEEVCNDVGVENGWPELVERLGAIVIADPRFYGDDDLEGWFVWFPSHVKVAPRQADQPAEQPTYPLLPGEEKLWPLPTTSAKVVD